MYYFVIMPFIRIFAYLNYSLKAMSETILKDIFEQRIKIESKVRSILSLFFNTTTVDKTDYKPPYQRNYVWDDEKATYFIESIFLGTEIPPLIYYCKKGKNEIIDGRQRYETILRFIDGRLKLKKSGFTKLGSPSIGLVGRSFEDLSPANKSLFEDTKIRVIEFSFHSENIARNEEELVKKEIFQRYNSGITPLKSSEIESARYYYDNLNDCIKAHLNTAFGEKLRYVLLFDSDKKDLMLKKVREILVLPQIPVKYYAIKKQTVIQKFFNYLSENSDDETIIQIYSDLATTTDLVYELTLELEKNGVERNRLISECLFWAISVIRINLDNLTVSESDKKAITDHIMRNIAIFETSRSSFYNEIKSRYEIMAGVFSQLYNVDFSIHLSTSHSFNDMKKTIDGSVHNDDVISFDDMRINKPEPSSSGIVDIISQMKRGRFLVRPVYQRAEVINKKKSSAIIESLLLGIKLPPIFIFKRNDGVSEVIDGQQRLLSILGYMGEKYTDAEGNECNSLKNNFALDLKEGILKSYSGKKYSALSINDKEKLQNSDIWIVEISERINPKFEPIDFFLRLNNKPYPIKRHSFEMWNSYVDRDIINCAKQVAEIRKPWFFLRKGNKRMENEEIIIILAYLEYLKKNENPDPFSIKNLDIYRLGNRINCRVKSKKEITAMIERSDRKDDIIAAINQLDFGFISKLYNLLNPNGNLPHSAVAKALDDLVYSKKSIRTQQNLYVLWLALSHISDSFILDHNREARSLVSDIFASLSCGQTVEDFKSMIHKLQPASDSDRTDNIRILLSDICDISIPSFDSDYDNGFMILEYNRNYERLNIIDSNTYKSDSTYYACNGYEFHSIRPGISPAFLKAIVGSTYFYHMLCTGHKSISIKAIGNQMIVLPHVKTQFALEILMKYIEASADDTSAFRFFNRLRDVAVLELYKPELFDEQISLLTMLAKLPNIEHGNNIDYRKVYDDLTDQESPFRVLVFNAITIEDNLSNDTAYR